MFHAITLINPAPKMYALAYRTETFVKNFATVRLSVQIGFLDVGAKASVPQICVLVSSQVENVILTCVQFAWMVHLSLIHPEVAVETWCSREEWVCWLFIETERKNFLILFQGKSCM